MRRWSAPAQLAKITPKTVGSFSHGEILSSQGPDLVFTGKVASCSSRRSQSPISPGSRQPPFHYQSRAESREAFTLPISKLRLKLWKTSIRGSAGDSPCYFIPEEDSSVEADTKDGEDSVSRNSETCDGHTVFQEGILEDVKNTFGEEQESKGDTVHVSNCNNFMCNRDFSILNLFPLTCHTTHEITNNLKTRLCADRVDKEKVEGEGGGGGRI